MFLQVASLKHIQMIQSLLVTYTSEGILAAPHNFKGLFDGEELVLRLRLELGLR